MNNAEMGHMSEANFGPEVQSITPEMNTLNEEGIVVIEQKKPGFLRSTIKKYGIPAVAGIALVFAACSGGDKNNDITVDTQTPTPTAGASLEPTPRTTPTLEPTPTLAPSNGGGSDGKFPTPTVTATSTPEAEQEVTCQILPVEYCAQGERVSYEKGEKSYTFIGFNLDAGVPLIAAADGDLIISIQGGEPFSGSGVGIRTKSGAVYDIRGNIDTSKFGGLTQIPIETGDVIGYTKESADKSLGYDIVFTITVAGASGPEVDEEALKKLLPTAFEKPSKKFASQIASKPATSITYSDPSSR